MSNAESKPSRSIDSSIAHCEQSIRSHRLSSVIEIVIGICLVVLVFSCIFLLARLEGQSRDNVRRALIMSLYEAEKVSHTASMRVEEIEKELQKLDATIQAPNLAPGVKAELEKKYSAAEYEAKAARDASTKSEGSKREVEKRLNEHESTPVVTEAATYSGSALFVVLLGVITSLYRYRLRQVAKFEHYMFGLMRIRVAANNVNRRGFQTEVRTSLTLGAFDTPTEDLPFGRRRSAENPFPGHLGSELAWSLSHAVIERLEKPHGRGRTEKSAP